VWKVLFYFSFDFQESIFYNKYDEMFSTYNRFLSLQTGLQKISKHFVNWNYIFTNSTQFLKAQKIFFLKYFFWNVYFNVFKKFKQKRTYENLKKIFLDGIYTWDWNTTILPFFINKIFYIHTGNKFMRVRVLPGMVGYKLGQFSFTWKIHPKGANLRTNFKNLF
jgi:ribosomal protein S19